MLTDGASISVAAWSAIGLDVAMIAYTAWHLTRSGFSRLYVLLGICVGLAWLGVLAGVLLPGDLLPPNVSGAAFFTVVLAFVGLVGLGFLFLRRGFLELSHRALLIPQGVRVYFGANFLIWGGLGVLPQTFGILDGLTHATAGFLALLAASEVDEHPTPLTWVANLFGLADILVVATTLAFVLLPQLGTSHPMMFAVFLPAPVWLWLHLFALYKAAGSNALPVDGLSVAEEPSTGTHLA